MVALAAAAPAGAQVDARMFRYPAVSADKIAFVYAGDIWLVPKAGGTATRLSSPAGEEAFPRFSPDGTKLAFTADYDGNADVYVMSDDRRHADAAHAITRWPIASSDGILTASAFCSPRAAKAAGSATTSSISSASTAACRRKLPVPYGEFGAFSPDARAFRLHADVAGLPQLEALSRRLGARPVGVRSEDVRGAQHHQQPGQRRAADVARQHHLLPVRPRRRVQRNNIWAADREHRRGPADHPVHRLPTSPSRRCGPDAIVFLAGGRLSSAEPARPRRRPKCRSASSPTPRRCGPRTAKADKPGDVARRCRRPADASPSRRAATSSPCRPSAAP